MESQQFFTNSNCHQVRNSHSDSNIRLRSTTQICLRKILHTISTFPRPETPKASSLSPLFNILEPDTKGLRGEEYKGFFDVDLNLRLGSPLSPSPLETEQSESPLANGGPIPEIDSPVVTTVDSNVEKSSVSGCDLRDPVKLFGRETPEIEDKVAKEKASEVQRLKIDDNGASTETTTDEEESKIEVEESKHQAKELRSKGGLDVLIEAAKFISGEFEDSEREPGETSGNRKLRGELCREVTRKVAETEAATSECYLADLQTEAVGRGSKRQNRSENWMVDLYGDFEDVSPVVRSRRGRNQVLPHKYRDSVLEPLKPLARHRAATVLTKRRSR